MTPADSLDDLEAFETYVGQQLADYADGEGDMAHDVLDRIQRRYLQDVGPLPEKSDD